MRVLCLRLMPNGKTSLLCSPHQIIEKPHSRRSTLRGLTAYCGQEHSRSLSKSIEFPPKISSKPVPSSISKAIFIHPTDRSSGADQHTCLSVLRGRGSKNWSSYINVSPARTVQWALESKLPALGHDCRPTQKSRFQAVLASMFQETSYIIQHTTYMWSWGNRRLDQPFV